MRTYGREGDFNGDGILDADDIDALHLAIRTLSTDLQFDLNDDGMLDELDSETLVEDLIGTYYGDANLDGFFDSNDVVEVLAMNEYEDGIGGNSGWIDGDWNGDAEFSSDDIVLALASGCYEGCGETLTTSAVPEPSTWCLAVAGIAICARRRW